MDGATLAVDRFGNTSSAYYFSGATIAASGLGVNTDTGAINSLSFWIKKDSSAGMPFSWATGSPDYDLYFYSGAFGFNTGNGDVFGSLVPCGGRIL